MLVGRDLELARALLGSDSQRAFDDGAAPLLAAAFEHPVANVLVADRAPIYLTVLFGMLLLRRAHELEPLHDDLERHAARALAQVSRPQDGRPVADFARDDQAFSRDIDQLVAWGCLERRAEPLKIRGYKDIRRERFRYRLTEDAVGLLESLEAGLERRLHGSANDGRDLLVDVLGHLKELLRVVTQWHKGERSEDAPRRAMHLLSLVDERSHAIAEELLAFRASMLAFAAKPYDLDALRAILAWLGRYVSVYLERIETLRIEIVSRLDDLAQPRFRRVLAEHHEILAAERQITPAAFRAGGVLRDPQELLDAQKPFFAGGGRLVELCTRIDDSGRAVLRKMARHLREIERRSARLEDLRARMAEVTALDPEAPDERLAAFANAVIGSAHARFGGRQGAASERVAPPMPRRHSPPAGDRAHRPPLRAKKTPPAAVRELRARKLAELRRWLDEHVLKGAPEAHLSADPPKQPDAPRRWADVARARHLNRGRDLVRMDLSIDAASGETRLGDEETALVAPDCVVRKGVAS
jgi:hypothetical protein